MKVDNLTKILLAVIAGALTATAVQLYLRPGNAYAQSSPPHDVYIEPGVQMLRAPDGSRQVYGKVVVDLHSGKVWGFPTMTTDPYPSSATETKPQTSHPFLLGRFALEDIDK